MKVLYSHFIKDLINANLENVIDTVIFSDFPNDYHLHYF